MAHTSSEVQTSSRPRVRNRDRQVPFGLIWLAFLSTSRWRPHSPVHPIVAACAARMEVDGWMIRGAWTRKYVLWRNGRTMREVQLPLLVLPHAYGRLSALQINVFLAVELFDAMAGLRHQPHGEFSQAATAELDFMLNAIAAEAGVIIAEPRRIHREVACALERVGN